jgi:type III restriction enzyme
MVQAKNLGTGDIPLKLAKAITEKVNKEYEKGDFLEKVSPITRDLLRFWDPSGSFGDLRYANFHEGQWQAILNVIYIHEILKIKTVTDIYKSIYPELLSGLDLIDLKKEKYELSKYCIKMATGTGKTWVLSAILIWQYLNAKYEESMSGRFSKNFLLIAPGLIVYERLLDAYLGKQNIDGTRNFEESDFKKFENLFLPQAYKEEMFGFIQSSVSTKDEIGKKVTGEGLIAITNWHLLSGSEEEEDVETPLDSPEKTVKQMLPITPGISAGHSLEELDNQHFRGKEIEYLANLSDLVVFNDEAHHLGEFKKSDDTFEKKWQKAIDLIAEKKQNKFLQIDFSATPYSVTGSGQQRTKHFFPHIITNFELPTAIKLGLVKTVAIDKRKELAALPLDFKSEREGNTILGLSDGQRIMLRAGISKLRILEEGFTSLDPTKYPKLLVMCEDTKVVSYVSAFLKQEGYSEDELIEVHSNKKGEISDDEWSSLKQKLFSIDKHSKPKIIISVLMLREGFDVSNICVIVPLRSSSSFILLEQTIGRGLRLMWREPQYLDAKKEIRNKLLVRKEEPDNYMDILSIIEHPAFIQFYDNELSGAVAITKEMPTKNHVVGDIISISLKENFVDYDFSWPIIIHDKEEHFSSISLSSEKLEKFPIPLDDLTPLVLKDGDTFYGEELTVKTKYGEYTVTSDIFTAKSYNSFIQKIVNAVSFIPIKIGKNKEQKYPIMQINSALVASLVDEYIRYKLFGQEFEPLKNNNWKVLLLTQEKIINHIVKNVSQCIYDLQNSLKVIDAKIIKRAFSEINEIKIRETYALDVAKTIYPKIAYPSNKGGFEKAFVEFIDADSQVKAFMKINEHYYDFANIIYIRDDGLLAHYFPDFLVRIKDKIYLVETKAEKDLNNKNVQQKRLATIDWIDKINELISEHRMDCIWSYVLLGENTFYGMSGKGANTSEILEYAKLTKAKIKGTLGDILGIKEY